MGHFGSNETARLNAIAFMKGPPFFVTSNKKRSKKSALYATVRLSQMKQRSLSDLLFLVIDLTVCELALVEAAGGCALLCIIFPPGYVA